MIKVSITLPNGVQITLESDSENVHEIVVAVLGDLPAELLSGGPPGLNRPGINEPGINETDQLNISRLADVLSRLEALLPIHSDHNVTGQSLPAEVPPVNLGASPNPEPNSSSPPPAPEIPTPPADSLLAGNSVADSSLAGNPIKENIPSAVSETPSAHENAVTGTPAKASEDSFIQFCRSVNPLGDMRRVVVAAEGAERFFRADGREDGVDAEELSRLFDLAGWTQPHSFTQTLRNAARSKFRWIERMPGRNGRYWVTERGKEIAHQG